MMYAFVVASLARPNESSACCERRKPPLPSRRLISQSAVRSTILPVDVVDLRHVGELHQAVRGERLVARRLAEPLVALLRRLVAGQQLVAAVEHALRLAATSAGIGGVVRAAGSQDHDVRVVRRRGLLEAAAGLADHALQPLRHRRERRRVHRHGGVDRAGQRAGEVELLARAARRADAVPDAADLEREAARHDADRLLELVARGRASRARARRRRRRRSRPRRAGRAGSSSRRRSSVIVPADRVRRELERGAEPRVERRVERLVGLVRQRDRQLDPVARRDLERQLRVERRAAASTGSRRSPPPGTPPAETPSAVARNEVTASEVDERDLGVAVGVGLDRSRSSRWSRGSRCAARRRPSVYCGTGNTRTGAQPTTWSALRQRRSTILLVVAPRASRRRAGADRAAPAAWPASRFASFTAFIGSSTGRAMAMPAPARGAGMTGLAGARLGRSARGAGIGSAAASGTAAAGA